MEAKDENTILERRGVKPTSNRVLVLRAMLKASRPVSLSELEIELDTVDKSSIFRVLTLFVSHHVAHAIEDGSGTMKYEVCTGETECTLSDMHTHFYCESCHRTFCFKSIGIPSIDLPDGFTMSSVNYMVKGICPQCAVRHTGSCEVDE